LRIAEQLVIACPDCASVIEAVSTDKPNTRFLVTAEGERISPGCGKPWRLAYTVSWEERPSESPAQPPR
jgi:hypothetical protein